MLIPTWIEEVFENYLSSEMTYLSKGEPSTFPVVVFYEKADRMLVTTSSVAFARKVDALRTNPKVCLLFSNPSGSGLPSNPVVMVQGLAEIDGGDLFAWKKYLPLMARKQPKAAKLYDRYCTAFLFRRFCHRVNDFYLMRILIKIRPGRILAWKNPAETVSPEVVDLAASGQQTLE